MLIIGSSSKEHHEDLCKDIYNAVHYNNPDLGMKVVIIQDNASPTMPILSINLRVIILCIDCADPFSFGFIYNWYDKVILREKLEMKKMVVVVNCGEGVNIGLIQSKFVNVDKVVLMKDYTCFMKVVDVIKCFNL
jgi:hypothetical protein